MMAFTSAKSRLMIPGTVMMSEMPWTAWRRMSSAIRKASKKLVPRSTVSIKRSLGMTMTVSTAPMSSCRACSACIMRRLPSKANGFVTTATLKAPSSLASEATTGAAPLPVPPPRPEVIKIIEALEGSDMIFITSGLGGGTGSGAAPVVASLASELGALSVAVVTKPFLFEGKRRMMQSEQALQELIGAVDTVIVIPNERLMDTVERGTSFFDAFRIADDILRQAVQGISDIITVPGIINRDFADVKAIMHGQGYAVLGTAVATG